MSVATLVTSPTVAANVRCVSNGARSLTPALCKLSSATNFPDNEPASSQYVDFNFLFFPLKINGAALWVTMPYVTHVKPCLQSDAVSLLFFLSFLS